MIPVGYLLLVGVILLLVLLFTGIFFFRVRARKSKELPVIYHHTDPNVALAGVTNDCWVGIDFGSRKPEIFVYPKVGITEMRYGHVHVHLKRPPELWCDWIWEEAV